MNPGSSIFARIGLGTVAATVSVVAGVLGASSPSSAVESASSSATPVNVGFMDIEGDLGINFQPQRIVAQQYVSYFNSHGGVHGHPVKLVTCVTQAASGGATCANGFVQKHAVLVFDYSITDGADAYPILKTAGVPVFGGGPASPEDAADLTPDGNHWFVGGGALAGFSVDNLLIAKTLKAKSVGLLVGTSGAAQQAAELFVTKPLAAMGVKTKSVDIQESNPDYTAAIDTLSDTDVLESLTSQTSGDSAFKQARQLGYKGDILDALDPTDLAAQGSAATGAYGTLASIVPNKANANQPAVKQYASLEKQYGWNWGDIGTYQLMATGLNVLKGAVATGVPTGLQVRNAFATATGVPIPLGGPAGLTCSKPQSALAPTACNVQLMLYRVQKGDSVKPVTGQWASPPS